MRITSAFAVLLFLLASGAKSSTSMMALPISGDYVEARTASVFAGACHYSGEYLSSGRDAVMAWNITSGQWNGVDLTGVRAAACVSADANLAEPSAIRHSELAIDNTATPQQAQAMTQMIESRYGSALGSVLWVRSLPISFTHVNNEYNVDAAGFVKMDVQSMPNNECCAMPNLVWYTPLIPVDGRKVGYTINASYESGTVADAWQRGAENSAFYGPIAQ